ncbi:MAG: histidinol dehydrogenase [Fimbriimonadaceae bacterium]
MSLLERIDTRETDYRKAVRRRAVERDRAVSDSVAETIADVRRRGDAALLDHARRFDAPDMESIHVGDAEWAAVQVPAVHAEAIRTAASRVRAFHEAQHRSLLGSLEVVSEEGSVRRWHLPIRKTEAETGTRGQVLRPLSSAGIYVPGGRAAYPSSVLMNVLPAKVAGVGRVVATSPARRDGTLHPAVLFAARTSEVDQIVKIGGAAAVAALALGTETIERVDKVAGPGNIYVNEAKRQLWGEVGVDGYAGPSEVAVLIGDARFAAHAAADLLTQVEHAPDNVPFLIGWDDEAIDAVLDHIGRQLEAAPRADVMRQALRNGFAIRVRDDAEAIDVLNEIAAEHVSLALADAEPVLPKLANAGCVLLGEWSPESAGDFVAGPSHTLPTGGAARWQSPVNVLDFIKIQSFICMNRGDLVALRPVIEAFGDIEGFPQHAFGASVRFEDSPEGS